MNTYGEGRTGSQPRFRVARSSRFGSSVRISHGGPGSPATRGTHIRAISCVAIAIFAAIACGCGSNKVSDKDIEFIEIEDAYTVGAGSTGVLGMGERKPVWIDPRTETAFREEHIPGAVNIPLGSLREDDARLEGFNVFIVYGSDYGDAVATAMTKRLLAEGFDDVRLLRGGLRGWKQAGNEVESGGG
jgi:rhodanese-related sulfurtransferase